MWDGWGMGWEGMVTGTVLRPTRPSKGDRTVGLVGIRIQRFNFPRRYQSHQNILGNHAMPNPPCLTMPCSHAIDDAWSKLYFQAALFFFSLT